ncbi:hypothetical protein N1031_19840 [Herbiconiux moechotypicola]|uniref:Uncharacterized protein n=1 Tax=Herbiconiux moechotypicola TaxID=637393 RepID=A0ABN3E7F6_9MICO|nr:hypothetical protein [Herbiconiux moechotypicola]MCS5732014.1 hypothetical protein [Herbiconiux moechotypicola]
MAEFSPSMMAGAFIKRPGMYLGQPIRFDRVTAYVNGYTMAIEQVREAFSSDHPGGFRPVGVEAQFQEQLRDEGRLRWDRWDLTIAAEAIGWTHDEPPVVEDFTVEEHRVAIEHLRPLLEKMFTLPDSLRIGPGA